LAAADVDIRALSLADTTDFGILRLIVNDPERAIKAVKDAGFTANVTEVIGVLIEDKPGGFSRAIESITNAGISVEYAYAFITPNIGDAYVIVRVEDNEKAEAALKKAGVKVVEQSEIISI
jgi:hypothetical protein